MPARSSRLDGAGIEGGVTVGGAPTVTIVRGAGVGAAAGGGEPDVGRLALIPSSRTDDTRRGGPRGRCGGFFLYSIFGSAVGLLA
jgi:hypothetical protein